jgi:Ca2+-binding RTX toxin-like protein
VNVLGTDNRINVASSGAIESNKTAIQVNGADAKIVNSGKIDGTTNAIDIVNGGLASATIENHGVLTSASRALNIGGAGGSIENYGLVSTTASPRNGTIYGDRTAKKQVIDNHGIIDVGAGNNGDALSMELGANVDGAVTNHGTILGRGVAAGAPNNKNNQASAVRLYAPTDLPLAVFNGDIKNSGLLSAENGATLLIEDKTQLNGQIINSGIIQGGKTATGGSLAIDVSLAEGDNKIKNSGIIVGDVLLGEGNDLFEGARGKVDGSIDGGAGNDTLIGGKHHDRLFGGAGNDILMGNKGDDFLSGGAGIDTLTGGQGRDAFALGKSLAAPVTAANGILVVNQPDILTDYQSGKDKFALNQGELGIAGDVKFQSGNSSALSGDGNIFVLQDGFANAAAAAKAIANNDNITADAGVFAYFNTTLGIGRVVASADLGDGGEINVLANLNNITSSQMLSCLSAQDFTLG